MSGNNNKTNTRSLSNCPIVGAPSELPTTILPTLQDMLKCYLLIRDKLKFERSGKDPSIFEIAQKLAERVEIIWRKSFIPTVSRNRIVKLIQDNHVKYLHLIRYPQQKRNKKYELKVQSFREDAKKLFDIAACKCMSHALCKCEKQRKVPILEHKFIQDQRATRKMRIGPVDFTETKKNTTTGKKEEERVIETYDFR
ncbi:unnamed protein product [Brassicogethes aeneus]|uniref:Uncharacterized protein n=1 Tax=Brassicogethes aeneus TaxID=1431903 RepID=A0A9P0FHK3_BRAAE|nr:unnamed protein product [Brassicogethes aeneus]